jgi:hypothetical protein
MKRLLVVAVLVAAALLVGHVGDATATCTFMGKIVYINSTSAGTYIHVAPASITSIPYVVAFSTTSVMLANTALSAFASGSRVNATGNAATCPTTGVNRAGGILSQLGVYRNQ